jgi:hypothetical protein
MKIQINYIYKDEITSITTNNDNSYWYTTIA